MQAPARGTGCTERNVSGVEEAGRQALEGAKLPGPSPVCSMLGTSRTILMGPVKQELLVR